jgi:hypothetical protein
MRVLVAIDGSDSASLAVDLVADAAWPGGTTIRVVEAIETGAALFGGPWPTLALVQADELEAQLRLGANTTVQEGACVVLRPRRPRDAAGSAQNGHPSRSRSGAGGKMPGSTAPTSPCCPGDTVLCSSDSMLPRYPAMASRT